MSAPVSSATSTRSPSSASRALACSAVADPDTARAQRLAQTYGVHGAYDDYRRLLERADIDMICVGAPNFTHRDIVVAAAEAGKHVVCEKPLARTMAEADEMLAAADRAGIKLMYAELICFAPSLRARQGAHGRGRLRPRLPDQARRDTLRPALGLVLAGRAAPAAAC